MLFDSALYIIFLIVVFIGYGMVLRRSPSRVFWLLAASYLFYASWNAKYLLLIVISTVIDFTVGLGLGRARSVRARRLLLLASLISNLGMLAFFKYANFFLDSLKQFLEGFVLGGETVNMPVVDVLLPVGISFYTFQTLSYTIDVYRGKLEPIHDPLKFALFVSFFPQLVAGPIVRATEFLPQLERLPSPHDVRQHSRGLALIMVGLIKKVAIADYLALHLVDRVFESPLMYSSIEMLMAVYGYAIQIYCDFSGYSDVAIGSALLLGFRLTENFNRPYAACNLQDFWRRWHISLSSWLRDYLYIPLGGSRGGPGATYRNLLTTMLLGGLWHGASWNFVIWGALHGGVLAANRAFQRAVARHDVWESPPAWFRQAGLVTTFHFVCFAWIFFRTTTFTAALEVLEVLSDWNWATENLTWTLVVLILGSLTVHLTPRSWESGMRELFVKMPWPARGVFLLLVAIALQQLKGSEVVPFIYFQF